LRGVKASAKFRPPADGECMHDLSLYLSPAEYIDSDHAAVIAHAKAVTAGVSEATEKARRLYLAVRDGIRYAPYVDYTDRESFRASSVLAAGQGYCVGKARSTPRSAAPPASRLASALPT
jgi:transglutaminase-like putative cysteine protease